MDANTTQYVGIGVGLLFGAAQKYLMPKVPNWLIPVVNPLLGALVGHFVPSLGLSAASGGVIGLASVGGHQAIKQPIQRATGRTL